MTERNHRPRATTLVPATLGLLGLSLMALALAAMLTAS